MAPKSCNEPPAPRRGPNGGDPSRAAPGETQTSPLVLEKHFTSLVSQGGHRDAQPEAGRDASSCPRAPPSPRYCRPERSQSGSRGWCHFYPLNLARADQIARETNSKVKCELTQTSLFFLNTPPPLVSLLCADHTVGSWNLSCNIAQLLYFFGIPQSATNVKKNGVICSFHLILLRKTYSFSI